MQEVFEKIIEKLNSKKAYFQGFYECEGKTEHDADLNKVTQLAFDEAIEIVKQAATDYNNGWIPCSEPPKNDRYVLLSFDNFSVPMVGRYEEDEKGGSYYIGDEMEPCVTQDIFVNAWQPLPLPYTKGE